MPWIQTIYLKSVNWCRNTLVRPIGRIIEAIMRRLIFYFRQVFCRHTWEAVQTVEYRDSNGQIVKEVDNYVCSKCLYTHRVKVK